MDEPVERICVFGSAADQDGVCVEHGETACVIGLATSVPA